MGFENRKCEKLNQNLTRQITNLEQQQKNSNIANTNLSNGLKACKEDLKKATRKAKGLKIGLVTLTPVALIGGIWLGTKFSN